MLSIVSHGSCVQIDELAHEGTIPQASDKMHFFLPVVDRHLFLTVVHEADGLRNARKRLHNG